MTIDEDPTYVGTCRVCFWHGPERPTPSAARADAEEHLTKLHGGHKNIHTDPAVPGDDMPHERKIK